MARGQYQVGRTRGPYSTFEQDCRKHSGSATVGTRIADARKAKRMTQADLAAELNVSRQYVQKVESGRRQLTWTQFQKFDRIIGPIDGVCPERGWRRINRLAVAL